MWSENYYRPAPEEWRSLRYARRWEERTRIVAERLGPREDLQMIKLRQFFSTRLGIEVEYPQSITTFPQHVLLNRPPSTIDLHGRYSQENIRACSLGGNITVYPNPRFL